MPVVILQYCSHAMNTPMNAVISLSFLALVPLVSVAEAVSVSGSVAEPGRLTPPESPEPRINGAKVFGVRPGSPLFFQLAVSGERPMRFTAEGLPSGATPDRSAFPRAAAGSRAAW